jgi:hypothetical protein
MVIVSKGPGIIAPDSPTVKAVAKIAQVPITENPSKVYPELTLDSSPAAAFLPGHLGENKKDGRALMAHIFQRGGGLP